MEKQPSAFPVLLVWEGGPWDKRMMKIALEMEGGQLGYQETSSQGCCPAIISDPPSPPGS